MTTEEISKELSLSYYELCSYLIAKYGPALYDYFCNEECSSKNKKVTRTSEGLVCHHMDEDKGGSLSNPPQARTQPFDWQRKERLVYCNYLEHLILHMKIAVLRQRDFFRRPTDIQDFFTTGGIYMICSDLNDLLLMPEPKLAWKKKCLDVVKENYDDYLCLLGCLARYITTNYIGEKDTKTNLSLSKNKTLGACKVYDYDVKNKVVTFQNNNRNELPLNENVYSDCLNSVLLTMSKGYYSLYADIYETVIAESNCKDGRFDEAFLKVDFDPTRRIHIGKEITYIKKEDNKNKYSDIIDEISKEKDLKDTSQAEESKECSPAVKGDSNEDQSDNEKDRIISSSEVAEILGVSKSTVYSMIKDGRICGYKDKSGKYCITLNSVKDYQMHKKIELITEITVSLSMLLVVLVFLIYILFLKG